ncbi:MAG: DUF1295 domain-containing protein [Candidatus Babeliales bacterium]
MMSIILGGVILLLIYFCCMVAVLQLKGDTSIGNFTWGGGVLLVTLYTFLTLSSFATRQIVVTVMVIAWASRLIMHVYKRYTGTDPRFIGWHAQGLHALIVNTVWVFGQTIMIAAMSYPIVLINLYGNNSLTIVDIIGVLMWVFGYCYEAISDYQLVIFIRDPHNTGKVMQTGLWYYSRHPNYLGEIIMWWGIYCMALSVHLGFTAIIAPMTIMLMLICITGIPLLEKAMATNAQYQEYKRTTPTLIPWSK